jgi:hypothetical protein
VGWEVGRSVLQRSPRLSAVAIVVAVVPFLYIWPLVDGANGGQAADVVLRVLAAIVVSLTAAHCLVRNTGATRAAWGAVLVGAQVLAATWVAELVAVVRGTAGLSGAVETGAHLLLALAVAGAVYRLAVHPAGSPVRRVVEVAALACATGLVVLWIGQVADVADAPAETVARAGADALLIGVGLLALLLAATPHDGVRWPLLGGGAVVLGTAGLLDAGL